VNDVQLSDNYQALAALHKSYGESHVRLIALQKQARQLANNITTEQRKQYAIHKAMGLILDNTKATYSVLDLL
jgi:hypothetical protein